jgi:hypothetical protein
MRAIIRAADIELLPDPFDGRSAAKSISFRYQSAKIECTPCLGGVFSFEIRKTVYRILASNNSLMLKSRVVKLGV